MVFEDKLKEMNGEKDNTNELMETMILKNKYKYDSEVKTMQVEALTTEVTNNRRQVQLFTLKNQELERQHWHWLLLLNWDQRFLSALWLVLKSIALK